MQAIVSESCATTLSAEFRTEVFCKQDCGCGKGFGTYSRNDRAFFAVSSRYGRPELVAVDLAQRSGNHAVSTQPLVQGLFQAKKRFRPVLGELADPALVNEANRRGIEGVDAGSAFLTGQDQAGVAQDL